MGCGGMLLGEVPPFSALTGVQPDGESPPPCAICGVCEWHCVAGGGGGLPAVEEGEDCSLGSGTRPPPICGLPLMPLVRGTAVRGTAVDISASAEE